MPHAWLAAKRAIIERWGSSFARRSSAEKRSSQISTTRSLLPGAGGGFTAAFETITGGMDSTEMLSSLPGGMCQTPNWGYVVKGRARIKYADREEILSAGDAYYLPPGHIPVIEEDSVIVEFSPLGDYQETLKTLES